MKRVIPGDVTVVVPSKVTIIGGPAMLAISVAGGGLMYSNDAMFQQLVQRGELELVLEEWASHSLGYHIYYSSRRQVPKGLKLLIELIRELHPLGR